MIVRGTLRRPLAIGMLVAVLCVLLLFPVQSLAIGIDDYASDVHEARMLAQRARDTELDERAATDLAIEINLLVPSGSDVETADGTVEADNSIVRTLISQLDAADTVEERDELVEDIYQHLLSLESSLGEPTDEPIPHDAEALSGLVDEAPEDTMSPIQELLGDLIDRLGKAIAAWWASVEGSPSANSTISTVMTVIVVALACMLLFILVRLLVRWRRGLASRDKSAIDAHVGVDLVVEAARDLPDDALSYADRCARDNNTREAVRALFGGAARGLHERGYIVEARTLTDCELLLQVRPRSERIHEPLEALTRIFEYAWYGHREVDEGGYAKARALYVRVDEAAAEGGEPS